MRIFIHNVVDSIFPPTEEALTVRNTSLGAGRALLLPHQYETITILSHFKDPAVRALIHEAKFHQNTRAFIILADLLRCYLETLPQQDFALIPIPLSRARIRERGYNQVSEVLKRTCDELPHLTIDEKALTRTKNTVPQTSLDRAARLTNMTDAFVVKKPKAVTDKHIILIDDVVTTGATIRAVEAALLPHGPASLTKIALAH